MKNFGPILFLVFELFLVGVNLNGQTASQKEVLIIGTMHEVPKIIKHSYRPLLKKAIAYDPQAIFVERPMAEDSLSLKNVYGKFLSQSDSISAFHSVDSKELALRLAKPLSSMTKEDFAWLKRHFIIQKDYANAEFYSYLHRHGIKGSKKPTRNENGDLTAKLAIEKDIKVIKAMDNQWYRKEYHQAWRDCVIASKKDGEIAIVTKMHKKAWWKERFNGAIGRYGLYTNATKTTQEYHTINSFRYRETECEPCQAGSKYWDLRNREMARNVGEQIRQGKELRNVVVVGAGHVVGMKEVLEAEYPDIQVKVLGK